MLTVTFTPATADSVDTLGALKRDVTEQTMLAGLPAPARQAWHETFSSPRYFAQRLADGNQFTIAGDPASPDAYASVKHRPDRDCVAGEIYCRRRRSGLGTMLLDQRFAVACDLGVRWVCADVFDRNPACRMFLDRFGGFEPYDQFTDQALGVTVTRLRAPVNRRRQGRG